MLTMAITLKGSPQRTIDEYCHIVILESYCLQHNMIILMIFSDL